MGIIMGIMTVIAFVMAGKGVIEGIREGDMTKAIVSGIAGAAAIYTMGTSTVASTAATASAEAASTAAAQGGSAELLGSELGAEIAAARTSDLYAAGTQGLTASGINTAPASTLVTQPTGVLDSVSQGMTKLKDGASSLIDSSVEGISNLGDSLGFTGDEGVLSKLSTTDKLKGLSMLGDTYGKYTAAKSQQDINDYNKMVYERDYANINTVVPDAARGKI